MTWYVIEQNIVEIRAMAMRICSFLGDSNPRGWGGAYYTGMRMLCTF